MVEIAKEFVHIFIRCLNILKLTKTNKMAHGIDVYILCKSCYLYAKIFETFYVYTIVISMNVNMITNSENIVNKVDKIWRLSLFHFCLHCCTYKNKK